MKEKELKALSLSVLTWPILIEMLLQFIMGTIDTLMVSKIGDNAVSAVGVSNQVFQTILTLFAAINAGATILTARAWGSNSREHAQKVVLFGLKVNLIIGVALSLLFFFGSSTLLGIMGAPSGVRSYANDYLTIIGSCTLITVLQTFISATIRSIGNTKGPMQIAIGMNVLHLFLNYILIFGELGFPAMGIHGAAISTCISRGLAMAASIILLLRGFPKLSLHMVWSGKAEGLWKEIMRIGLPVSVTAVSWGYSQIVLISVLSAMGEQSLAAYTYLSTVQQLPWLIASSIGTALQIRVAQFYGAGLIKDMFKSLNAALKPGLILVFVVSLGLLLSSSVLMSWFTQDTKIIHLAYPAFVLCVIWQPVRVIGFCASGALNAIGDAKIVAILSIIGMWVFTAGGSYVLGILLGYGLVGVFIAMLCDELLRSGYYLFRWKVRSRREAAAN
ncbi:putative FMN/FAD exporter YeeO [Paenibacillus auburnensis]|uniref:FMN/FAD exporter YeeO n=1 Tax=Paenibacillus auburnensis TaxID=2905649 RepID=A0ABM9CTF9_9BACL|nr:MATE family efflux transporter [Paenibacillus auburnensis]CAH1221789.1 putative FMN/FAD exporter YeeO [Paenibacillus auburnensis]